MPQNNHYTNLSRSQNNHYTNLSRSQNNRQRQEPAEQVQSDIQIGQRFPLTIRRLGINGEGIGYYKHVITLHQGCPS